MIQILLDYAVDNAVIKDGDEEEGWYGYYWCN